MRLVSPTQLYLLFILLLPIALVAGLTAGPVHISLADVWAGLNGTAGNNSQAWQIVQLIRLPRVILAVLVGALLAGCGAILQGLFRNPLADPTLVGVSAGASVGASGIIFLSSLMTVASHWLGMPLVVLGAFIGALLTTALVYQLATGAHGTSVSTMLLAGIAISAIAGALNQLLSFFADNDALRRISLWHMGNLDNANWLEIGLCSLVVLLLAVFLPRDAHALNALLLGESEARHLGIDIQRLKRRLIVWVALGVAMAVSVAGAIAFVGLIVPHVVRLLIGPDHRQLLPASAIAGALLLLLADLLSRVLVAPAELPVGVVTALLGAPFFIMLLVKHRRV